MQMREFECVFRLGRDCPHPCRPTVCRPIALRVGNKKHCIRRLERNDNQMLLERLYYKSSSESVLVRRSIDEWLCWSQLCVDSHVKFGSFFVLHVGLLKFICGAHVMLG